MVKTIVICGPPAALFPTVRSWKNVSELGRVIWVPNLDSPSRSANSALAQIDQQAPVLLTTADHALLTPSIVQYFLSKSRTAGSDAAVGVVKHEDVAAAFPGAKRTVIRLRDGGLCGCNLYAFLNPRGRGLVSFWQRAEDLRKRPWLLIAQTFGPVAVIFICWDCCRSIRGLRPSRPKPALKCSPCFCLIRKLAWMSIRLRICCLRNPCWSKRAPLRGGKRFTAPTPITDPEGDPIKP